MENRHRLTLFAMLLGLLSGVPHSVAVRADALSDGFVTPPPSARPHTWWHWMNGNVTKEGITADLEAMKRVGVGGAQIFDVSESIPQGPVKYMSPQWRDMIKHAVTEAHRLGIEICLYHGSGFSSTGGPWVTPENSMQMIVTSELKIKGPQRFAATLPQPHTRRSFYRDIATLAFRTPRGEQLSMTDFAPVGSASAADFDATKVLDGNISTSSPLPLPTSTQPQWVQVAFARPFEARSMTLVTTTALDGAEGQLQVSDDGNSFRTVLPFSFTAGTSMRRGLVRAFEPVSARFFRVNFTSTGSRSKNIPVSEIKLSSSPGIDNLDAKAAYERMDNVIPANPAPIAPELVVDHNEVLDLTAQVGADGRLTWDAPAGDWTVVRFGSTTTNRSNHPATEAGIGLETDKMSREASDHFFANMMQKIIDDVGPLAGKSLNNALIDSYEVGSQNWTPKFRAEFQKRRGYDLQPFLPAITGRIINSPAETERFLWDFRQTIAELFNENYFARFAELGRERGLLFSVEPYGDGPFNDLTIGAHADVPMGEFWIGAGQFHTTKLASSIAHTNGRKFVGAEAFTATANAGGWRRDPFSFKALGDAAFSNGINRYIFHRYAHQPWLDRSPGMTFGRWGIHFERTNTWWEQSSAWLQYVARCQYLLQQGLFVADASYYVGENAPVTMRSNDPALPPGYDYDLCGADVLLNRMSVRNGRTVLPDGMSYRVLVLPPDETMTPRVLRKIRQLVSDGATIVGPRPLRSPSLQDYPESDAEIKTLADEIWGKADGKTFTEHTFGKGRVFWGRPMPDVLAALQVSPDFEFANPNQTLRATYIHRVVGDTDVYFVSNQNNTPAEIEASFRVANKVPELWYADSGRIEAAPLYTQQNGRTTIPLRFDPAGSVFVVFRPRTNNAPHLVSVQSTFNRVPSVNGPRLEIVKAVYEAVDGSGSVDVTRQLAAMVKNNSLTARVSNDIADDPTPSRAKQLRIEYTVDGKASTKIVPEYSQLTLPDNGEPTLPNTGPKTTDVSFELRSLLPGRVQISAWKPAEFTLKTSTGKNIKASVSAVPQPLQIAGSWQLSFPPNWGAPPSVTLDKLISWTEHANPGVKYFSGTATYHKDVVIPANLVRPDTVLYLDLGQLKNIARVKFNNTDLGILWKPPFRVDVSELARAGNNKLEVQITNLWPNRLIGDEQLPPDVEWNGNALAKWPQWLLEGKPSPTGRLTFSTWHHWTKEMEPLESGLLGPVTLRPVSLTTVSLQ
jgi:hypothetical protein